MIEVKDRIPKKPNRILITPENGSAPFYATWQRADEPIEEGTPINKVLFDSIEEGGFSFTGVDDIEICAMRITTNAEWTEVVFDKPFSGIPRVFASTEGTNIVSFQNVTRTGCQIAVYSVVYKAAYLSTTSGGSATTSANVATGLTFAAAPVDILIVYDGGVNL